MFTLFPVLLFAALIVGNPKQIASSTNNETFILQRLGVQTRMKLLHVELSLGTKQNLTERKEHHSRGDTE